MINRFRKVTVVATAFVLLSACVRADEIRVAVASNFKEAITALGKAFEDATGHTLVISSGSTGKHFAQIKHGAPFDVFFAADSKRPELLESEGVALAGSRFTYAYGRLVLWSPSEHLVDDQGFVLGKKAFRFLSMANPNVAPYGRAAKEVLKARNLWEHVREQTVRGENVGQAFQYVMSGNAELGFVAYSQIKRPGVLQKGSAWLVPQELYHPIIQQAVQLTDHAAAAEFLTFVRSDEALNILSQFGYSFP